MDKRKMVGRLIQHPQQCVLRVELRLKLIFVSCITLI